MSVKGGGVNPLSVKGGGGVNPQSATNKDFFLKMQSVLKRKSIYFNENFTKYKHSFDPWDRGKDFVSKSYVLGHSGSAKKRFFLTGGGG